MCSKLCNQTRMFPALFRHRKRADIDCAASGNLRTFCFGTTVTPLPLSRARPDR